MTSAGDARITPTDAAPVPAVPLWQRLLGLLQRPLGRTVVDLDDPLGGAMQDAEVLLAFASQSRYAMKRENVQALTTSMATLAGRRLQRQEPTPEELTAFWLAYDELGSAMAPLSALSIRSSMRLNAKRFPLSLFTATGMNAMFAFIVFFACILLQGFWGAGRELLDKAEALDAQKADLEMRIVRHDGVLLRRQSQIEELNLKLCPPDGLCPEDLFAAEPVRTRPAGAPASTQKLGKEDEAKLRAEKQLALAEMREKDIVLGELSSELQTLNERSKAVEAVLQSWSVQTSIWCDNPLLKILCPIRERTEKEIAAQLARTATATKTRLATAQQEVLKIEALKESAPAARDVQLPLEMRLANAKRAVEVAEADSLRATLLNVRLTLANIANYLIPMLMGLLGALAFILRSLTIQLREHTYVHMSASLSVVRMCLGAVAGVFGTMLAPGGDGALKGLPPLIVPFVFGYGIEILFSIMDRVVGSFTQAEGTKTGEKAPA